MTKQTRMTKRGERRFRHSDFAIDSSFWRSLPAVAGYSSLPPLVGGQLPLLRPAASSISTPPATDLSARMLSHLRLCLRGAALSCPFVAVRGVHID
jgi:hypothetical protein